MCVAWTRHAMCESRRNFRWHLNPDYVPICNTLARCWAFARCSRFPFFWGERTCWSHGHCALFSIRQPHCLPKRRAPIIQWCNVTPQKNRNLQQRSSIATVEITTAGFWRSFPSKLKVFLVFSSSSISPVCFGGIANLSICTGQLRTYDIKTLFTLM